MTREQLAHVLRAVSQLTGDPDVLVIGSQSILGSYPEDELPPEATGSMEVDTAFLSDPDDAKSDLVDVNVGELSEFHHEFGYYPQGVSVSTGVFPTGWEDRLVTFETPGTRPGRGLCLEPHDCILGKLVRFDEKDQNFAYVLVRARLIDLDILDLRADTLPTHPAVIQRIQTWIQAMRAGNNSGM
jgi:hypothetical protein